MNYPPTPGVGYYQGSSGDIIAAKLKCIFCDSILLPLGNSHSLSPSHAAGWLCVACPNPVSYDSDLKKHQILVNYSNCWYEIRYLHISKQYVIFRWESSLIIQPENGTEHYSNDHKFILKVESENNITPTNAKDKLSTMLTFL